MKTFFIIGLLPIGAFAAGIGAGQYDPLMAEKSATVDTDGVKWIDGRHLPLEGKAFSDVDRFYDRLPSGVTTNVNDGVRSMKSHTAGMQFRFRTTSPFVSFMWCPIGRSLAMTHMPATGMSGIDVYRQDENGQWWWVKTGFPSWPTGTLNRVSIKPNTPICVNLPLYNGITYFALGIDRNAKVEALGPRKSGVNKPVVFYGTSVTHGGCASRPGMAFPSIVGRALDVPIVNLGFSGSGVMEFEMSEHLACIDASCYVLDCLGNMGLERPPASFKGYRHKGYLRENYEPFIRNLRRLRPEVPIVMASDDDVYNHADCPKNTYLKGLYEKLVAEGWKNLVLLPGDHLLTDDGEGTVDGSHPNDYGMKVRAEAYGAAVREALTAFQDSARQEGIHQ